MHTLKITPPPTSTQQPQTLTLTELNAQSATLQRHSSGLESLTLQLPTSSPLIANPAPGVRAELFSPAGSRTFTGWLTRDDQIATGKAHSRRWLFQGLHFALSKTSFLQPDWFEPTDLNTLDGALQPFAGPRVILNAAADGSKTTLPQQLQQILQAGIDAGLQFTWDLSQIPDIKLPEEELPHITLQQALERLLDWLPHCHLTWQHHATNAQGQPVPHLLFRIQNPARPLNHPQAVTRAQLTRLAGFPIGELQIQSFLPQTRSYPAQLGNTSRTWFVRKNSLAQAIHPFAHPAAVSRLALSFYLRGAVTRQTFDESTGTWNPETVIPGEEELSQDLAQTLHTGFATPADTLELEIQHPDIDFHLTPGNQLQLPPLPGIPAAASATQSVTISHITFDLLNALTKIHAGPRVRPQFWDPTFLTLLAERHNQARVISSNTRRSGTPGPFHTGFGQRENPTQKVQIHGCQNGQPVYYLFQPHLTEGPYPT